MNKTTITIRIQPDLLEKSKRAADQDRRSLSSWIRVAIENYLKEKS